MIELKKIILNNKYINCFIFAFICWLIPFLIRISLVEITYSNDIEEPGLQTMVGNIIEALNQNDRKEAFVLIFTNNIKGCIINIVGGALLGLGTGLNLVVNGFCTADIFMHSYKMGVSIKSIIKLTLPHSFELIGFWMSGALGFYIAYNIFQLIRGKEKMCDYFYITVTISLVMILLIILFAAYIEAYISTNFIN